MILHQSQWTVALASCTCCSATSHAYTLPCCPVHSNTSQLVLFSEVTLNHDACNPTADHEVLCLQMVMLGSGGDEYETAMRENERLFPQHFRGWVRLLYLCLTASQNTGRTVVASA
jgi:hypothetical protein